MGCLDLCILVLLQCPFARCLLTLLFGVSHISAPQGNVLYGVAVLDAFLICLHFFASTLSLSLYFQLHVVSSWSSEVLLNPLSFFSTAGNNCGRLTLCQIKFDSKATGLHLTACAYGLGLYSTILDKHHKSFTGTGVCIALLLRWQWW